MQPDKCGLTFILLIQSGYPLDNYIYIHTRSIQLLI